MTDTIFALSSAPGRAGVAVVRLSGPQSIATVCRLAGRVKYIPRTMHWARFRHPVTGDTLDEGLWAVFPAPHSFTGEDVVELHLHGSKAVIDAVSRVLSEQGLRPAEPGEFTRRAFQHGRMDLTRADGLADLLAAETEIQRQQALRQLEGAQWRLYDRWRGLLIEQLALVEAFLDFPEEDIPGDILSALNETLATVQDEVTAHLADAHRGERRREGVRIALVGAPNAGKSSLLNALARRDVAIVSPVAGTTRDVIEVMLDLGGYPVVVADTAGFRDQPDMIEAEGIRRARDWMETADVVLHLHAPDVPGAGVDVPAGALHLAIWNKADTGPEPEGMLAVSALTGQGIDGLLSLLAAEVAARYQPDTTPALTHARYRHALGEVLGHLQQAGRAALPELLAEDIRLAVRALGRIVGAVDIDEVLDQVFSRFCIGK